MSSLSLERGIVSRFRYKFTHMGLCSSPPPSLLCGFLFCFHIECCIFHKQREFGESSSEDDSDIDEYTSDSSHDSSMTPAQLQQQKQRKERRAARRRKRAEHCTCHHHAK